MQNTILETHPPEAGGARRTPVETVRVGGMMGFPTLVKELGGDPDSLLARFGLDSRLFDDNDNIISFKVGARLLQAAALETSCPHFGLLLGQRQNLTLLGQVSFLMQHSPDVRTALHNLIRYMHLHVEGATAKLLVEGGMAQFTYLIHLHRVTGADQVYNICMANQFNFLRLLCGQDWLPTAVHFAYRTPKDISPFHHLFHVPVHFNRESSAVVFSAHYLDRPIINANPDMRKILQDYLDQTDARHSGNLYRQVLRVLHTLLPTGKCTVDRVADLFSMHRRTLHRQLGVFNTTFEEMVDAARCEIAIQTLQESDISLIQLANRLGYHNASAFTRAFRRWSGVAPREWRTRRKTEDIPAVVGNLVEHRYRPASELQNSRN